MKIMFMVMLGAMLGGCAQVRFPYDPEPGHALFEQVPPRTQPHLHNSLNCKGTPQNNPACWQRQQQLGQ